MKVTSDKNLINRSLYVRYTDSLSGLKTLGLDRNVVKTSLSSAKMMLNNTAAIKSLQPKIIEVKDFLALDIEPKFSKSISAEEVGYLLCSINSEVLLYNGIISGTEPIYKGVLQRIIYDKALIDDKLKLDRNAKALAKRNKILPVQEFSYETLCDFGSLQLTICTFNEIQLKDIQNKQRIYSPGNGLFLLLNDMDMIKWLDASQP